MYANHRLTVRMTGTKLNLSHITVHQILTNELGMRNICSKLVPRNLKQDQKDMRRDSCVDFLESIENDPHFVFEYSRNQAPEHGMAHSKLSKAKKPSMSKSKIKSMLICFFDSQEIVHKEFVPPCQEINHLPRNF